MRDLSDCSGFGLQLTASLTNFRLRPSRAVVRGPVLWEDSYCHQEEDLVLHSLLGNQRPSRPFRYPVGQCTRAEPAHISHPSSRTHNLSSCQELVIKLPGSALADIVAGLPFYIRVQFQLPLNFEVDRSVR